MLVVANLSLISLLICWPSSRVASNPTQLLDYVQNQITSINEDLKQRNISRKELYQQLKQQSRTISQLNRELFFLDEELAKKTQELTILSDIYSAKQKSETRHINALFSQINLSYIRYRYSYIKIFLSQDNPATLVRCMTYYRYFHQARQQLLVILKHKLEILHKR